MTPWPPDLDTAGESNIGYRGGGDVAVIRVERDIIVEGRLPTGEQFGVAALARPWRGGPNVGTEQLGHAL